MTRLQDFTPVIVVYNGESLNGRSIKLGVTGSVAQSLLLGMVGIAITVFDDDRIHDFVFHWMTTKGEFFQGVTSPR